MIGGGVVGTHAARMAVGLGADVIILDRSLPRLRELDEMFLGRVRTRYSTLEAIEEEVIGADVVIGAVLVPGASAPKLVTRAHLARMKRGAVLVDVAIDQGGCFETSRPTTHADADLSWSTRSCIIASPTCRAPCRVTSSHALNNATLPFGLALAEQGHRAADRGSASARRAQRPSRADHQPCGRRQPESACGDARENSGGVKFAG